MSTSAERMRRLRERRALSLLPAVGQASRPAAELPLPAVETTIEAAAFTSIARVLRYDQKLSPLYPETGRDVQVARMRDGDAALALLALRNMLRAAEWFADDLDQYRNDSRAIVADFKAQYPDLVNARDSLEHFDDYALGRGRLQRDALDQYQFELVDIDGEPAVQIGPYEIRLRETRDACRWLALCLVARADYPDEDRERADALLDKVLAWEEKRKPNAG